MDDETHPHGVPGYPLLFDRVKRRQTELAREIAFNYFAPGFVALYDSIPDRLRTATPHQLPEHWPPANWRNQIAPVSPTVPAALQWFDLFLFARPHLESAQRDGNEALLHTTGKDEVADSYTLYYAVTNALGAQRTLYKPSDSQEFSLADAITELQRIRDALAVLGTGTERQLSRLEVVASNDCLEVGDEATMATNPIDRALGSRASVAVDSAEKSSWSEIAERLERLRSQGEKFTSQLKLGKRLGCSPSTINRAIRETQSLHSWAYPDKAPSLRAQSLNVVVTDNAIQLREPDPADFLDDDDVDVAMRRLMQDANPPEREKILAMSPEKQRELARVAYNDPAASERILGRQP